MIVGGGGRITSGYPDHVAIAMAWPQQEPDGYVVTFIRITEIVEPEYDTYFSAYAICAKMSVAE